MQDTKQCGECGSEDLDYKYSDRHRGYYDCECGNKVVVDYYA